MVESLTVRSAATREKSNKGFLWGLTASLAVTTVQLLANTNTHLHTDAMTVNALQTLDGSAYGVGMLAARHERAENLRRAMRFRRVAAACICMASACVGAKATYDFWQHDYDRPAAASAILVAASGAANVVISRKFRHDAEPGTAHRDGWRHAVVDAGSSFVSAGAILAASRGYAGADLLVASGTSCVTIIANAKPFLEPMPPSQ